MGDISGSPDMTNDSIDKKAPREEFGATDDSRIQKKLEDEELMSWEPYGTMDKKTYNRRIWRNIIILSIAFMLNYISYGGLSALQSSLHVTDGMGTICTSVRYVTLVLSCVFVPSIMIRAISHKWTITVSFIGFILWCAANGYGVWATMIPASIINGFFVAPLWAAQGAYFTGLAKEYAKVNNENEEHRIALFFGVYYMFYTGAGIFGNVISSTVLRATPTAESNKTDEEIGEICGMNDCPWYELEGSNAEEVPDSTVWTLVGIYMAIGICAILISIFFVDHLPRHLVRRSGLSIKQEFSTLLLSTLKQTIRKKQLLLIPLTIYMGLEESFFGAEYNRSWVTCALGISMIGLTNIPYAIMGAGVSFSGGRLVKIIGRTPIFVIGLCLDITSQMFLSFWTVDPSQEGLFFLVPVLWGSSDAIWITLLGALYGTFFNDNSEAAFSNYMLWWCFGLAVGFGYSNALCTNTKLFIVFSMLWVGIICYFLAEFVHWKEKNRPTGVMEVEMEEEEKGDADKVVVSVKVEVSYAH